MRLLLNKSSFQVLSMGGSLLSLPTGPSWEYVKAFIKLIREQIELGSRFIIITGGGQVCRDYQNALKKISKVSNENLDLTGIQATKLNAEFLRSAFGDIAHPKILENPNMRISSKHSVLLSGGWRPGRSSDDHSVRLAKVYGAKWVFNLSNIDFVYDKDPKIHTDAKAIESISWHKYLNLFGQAWVPGAHVPFDPVASRFAQKTGLKVYILNGSNLPNLKKALQGKTFRGTSITD